MANIHRVRAVSTGWTGAPGLNTFYFKNAILQTTPEEDAQLGADRVRAAMFELVNTFPQGHICTVDPVVDFINDENGELVESFGVTPPAPTNGIAVSGFQGIALMLLASWRTGGVVQGRRVSGRAFIGPVAEQQDTNGSPNADQRIKLAQFGAAMLDKGISGPDLVVWSRPKYVQPLADPPVLVRAGSSHVVTSMTSSDKYAVLRSRRD